MIKKSSFLKAIVVTATVLASCSAIAKPMPKRLGVGIKDNTSESLPSLAMVYHMSDVSAFTGGLGVDTQKNYSKFQVNAGIRHVIFHENQLHFYAGGQLGLVTFENPVDGKKNGFEADLVLGTEFFFTGLENVGFTFEGGIGLSSVKDTRIRTIADHPLRAGILFYF
ncbi:MAG: organic solvent tolerance protein [Pseudobdellovibrio sp.]